MLYAHGNSSREDTGSPAGELSTLREGIRWMFLAVVRSWTTVAAITLLLLLAAVAHILTRSPTYTAVSQVQISNLRLHTSRDDTFFAEAQIEPRFLETQMQILRSERIASSVIDQLNLVQVLAEKPKSSLARFAERVRALLGKSPAAEEDGSGEAARRAAIRMVQRGLSAQQVGLSEVIELGFSSDDRELSARIANDIVRAYIGDQAAARDDSAQTASSWLRERLREVGPRARVLTIASPPEHSSNIRGLLILAIAGVLGVAFGSLVALTKALLDGTVRVPEQVGSVVAAKFLGIVPRTPASAWCSSPDPSLLSHALREIRSAWTLDPSRRALRTLGIISTTRGEGRSRVAAELARDLAESGKRTLLIDADPHGGASTPAQAQGLTQWLEGEVESPHDVISREGPGGAHHLSAGEAGFSASTDWCAGLAMFLEAVESDYDYVIFDLPPLTVASDICRSAVIEDYLLVVGWAGVRPEHVDCALAHLAPLRGKLIGFVLSNVDVDQAQWYPSVELDLVCQRGGKGLFHSLLHSAGALLAAPRAAIRRAFERAKPSRP